MSKYPKDVEVFHQTLESLIGIENVKSSIRDLHGISSADLRYTDYSNLPIGALLRTDGVLNDEAVAQFEFTIDKSLASLISLEFLSWFVRDQSRGGVPVQLRAFAFPPQTPEGIQLGQTLKFCIDYFIKDSPESIQPILEKVSALNKTLTLAIQLYDIPTNP